MCYTGINKHEGEKVGGFDTVLSQNEYQQLYGEQQASVLIANKKPKQVVEKTIVVEHKLVNQPLQTEIKTPIIEPIKKDPTIRSYTGLKVGDSVMHKVFGQGVIKSFIDDKIIIAFGKSEKMFLFPDSFIKGFLSVE